MLQEECKKFTDTMADVDSSADELKNISNEVAESVKACQTNEPVEKLEQCSDTVYQKATAILKKVTEDIGGKSMALKSLFISAEDNLQKCLTVKDDLLKDSVEPDLTEEILNCVKA